MNGSRSLAAIDWHVGICDCCGATVAVIETACPRSPVRSLSGLVTRGRPDVVVTFHRKLTEPVMGPVRRLIPTIGMIDISPIVVFFGLRILQSAIGC